MEAMSLQISARSVPVQVTVDETLHLHHTLYTTKTSAYHTALRRKYENEGGSGEWQRVGKIRGKELLTTDCSD